MSPAVRRVTAALVALVGLAFVWWWLFPSDERLIRAACLELADRLSMPANEPDIARLTRVAQIAPYLDLDIVVEVEGTGAQLRGRNAVVGGVGRQRFPGGLEVTLDDLEVAVATDRSSADARAILTVREVGSNQGPAMADVRDLELRWLRTAEGWQLGHVQVRRLPGL